MSLWLPRDLVPAVGYKTRFESQRRLGGQMGEDERSPGGSEKKTPSLWAFFNLGFQLAVTVGLFVGLGFWLDRQFGWTPWGTVVVGMVGVAVGIYQLVRATS